METGLVVCHGAFLYARNTGRFLSLLRASSGRYQYTWSIPGGKQEINESPLDCLTREIEEEVGLLIRTEFVPIDSFTSENGRFVYNTYLCMIGKEFDPNLNNEHCGSCWVPLDHFPRPMHPGVFNNLKEKETREILLKLIEKT